MSKTITMGSNMSMPFKKVSTDMPKDELISSFVFNASMERFPIISYKDIDFIDNPKSIWSGYLKGSYHGTACSIYKLPYQSINMAALPSYIDTIKELANRRHPNVLIVYGVFQNKSNDLFVALERTENGTLRNLLDSELRYHLTWTDHFHEICIHVCRALMNYHATGLTHRDINSSSINVGLTTHTTKLGKYNLFQQEHDHVHHIYIAPEVLLGNSDHTQASDVYAFGIILYEIVSGMKPWEVPTHTRSLDTYRPEFPIDTKGFPKYVSDLYHACTAYVAAERPSIKTVLQTLMSDHA